MARNKYATLRSKPPKLAGINTTGMPPKFKKMHKSGMRHYMGSGESSGLFKAGGGRMSPKVSLKGTKSVSKTKNTRFAPKPRAMAGKRKRAVMR